MSGISGVGSGNTASSADSGTLGNAPPISFPGIASGIDYNAIIEKLTSLTLAQNKPLETESSSLTAQNTELIKINGLIQQVQTALTSLADPTLFKSFSATSSNTSLASAEQISGASPTPGTYSILSQTLATSTEVNSDPAANAPVSLTKALEDAGFQITPTNGTGDSNGKFTVDGVQLTYDVGTDTVDDPAAPATSIVNMLNSLVPGQVSASFQNDEMTLTSYNTPLSLGSASDQGNLEQIFKLDTAPLYSGQQEVSATGGVSATDTLGADGVTSGGTLTINGTNFTYTTGESVQTLINQINATTGLHAAIQNGSLVIETTNGAALSISDSGGAGGFQAAFNGGFSVVAQTSKNGGVTSADTLGGDGVTSAGTLTIDGNNFAYTTGETVQTLMTQINATSGLSASIVNGSLVIASTTDSALSITDTGGAGGFEAAFNGGFGQYANYQSVTSSSGVGGINPDATLNVTAPSLNGGDEFSINGVAISIDPATQNLQDIINEINSSNAGVTASWNTALGQLQLVNKATGPQSIVLGAPGDSSNFLSVFGLTTSGATTQTGQQASVTYQTASGATATAYSNSNQITSVIPGVTLTLQQSSNTPYTVTVAQSTQSLVSAINAFTTAYNNAIDEIDKATLAPVIQTAGPGTLPSSTSANSSVAVQGGVLFNNSSVQELKNQLVNLVSNMVQSGSNSYNSFASIGLQLDSSFSVIESGSTSGASDSKDSSDSGDSSGLQEETLAGTSGKLQSLDTTTFDSAFLADPLAVQSLFTSDSGVLGQMGTYLTYVTGSPTQLGPSGSFLGTAPDVSLIQSVENSNSAQIDSINQQIAMVNDEAVSQANQLRSEFTASETMIAELQQEQSSLDSLFGTSSTSSTS